jgi:hypothetical protein
LRLNLPAFEPKINQSPNGPQIFDPIRKTWVQLTNEEWVRQHILNTLTEHMGISKNLIAVEKLLHFNTLKKRFDICVYNNEAKPMLLVECKAFDITLSQQTILQVFTYNQVLQVPVLWISNGLRHMTFKMNAEQNFEFHSDDLIL